MPESNFLDIVILLFVVASIGRGLQTGFFRQVFSILGFFVGLFLASMAVPHILKFAVDPETQATFGPLLVLAFALVIAGAGDYIGYRIKKATTVKEHIKKIEAGLGVVVSIASVLIISWLLAAMVGRLPIGGINESINRSFILRTMNNNLPSAPAVIANIGRFVSPNGFPDVFVDEPSLSPTIPPSSPEVRSAAESAIASTVKIQGFGCGGIMTGSGFIIGDNLIATNAHVLAGMRRPVVYSQGGRYSATPVWFNPNLDFALLRVSGIDGRILPLANASSPRGTTTAVLGYPGGGRLEIDEGVILSSRQALGRNIYGTGLTTRPIYEVQTQIDQGNSGGPVVLADGSVAGIIFAKAVSSDKHAFAIRASAVVNQMEQAQGRYTAVSTGRCSSG